MKTIHISKENTRVYDMRKTRGYISIKHAKFYHKFRDFESYLHWLNTNEINLCWGETVLELIKNVR